MKRTAAFRFSSDFFFYFAILSFFPALLPLQEAMALFAAASLVVSLIAVYTPWAPLRFVLALLPGLAFLRAELCFPLVFPALAWLYLILVLTAGRFHIWLEGYRRSFRIMWALYLFSLLLGILLNLIKPGFTLLLPGIYYAAAFLCLAVLAMRRMQMNAEMSLRWNLANGAAVIGVPLLAAGCSLLLWQLLRRIRPFAASLIPYLRRFIAWLINTLLPINPDVPEPTPTPKPTLTPAEEAIVEPGWETPPPDWDFDWEFHPEQLEKAGRIGIWLLLILLALGLLFLFLSLARRNRVMSEQEDFDYPETEEANPGRRRKAERGAAVLSNARQVRIQYRKYMLLMRRRGAEIRRADTSREILDEAEQLSPLPDAQRLRELYLKARYGDARLVTPEDVQEAVLCLQKIREDQSWKN